MARTNDSINKYAAPTLNPGAGQQLAVTGILPAGYYQVDVRFYTSGTSTSVDSDNVGVYGTDTDIVAQLLYTAMGTQGTPAISAIAQTFYITSLGQLTLAINTVVASSGGGVTYHASLTVTRQNGYNT